MKYYLGLDVGGTNLAAGVVDENYHLLSRESIPAGAGRDIRHITADMVRVSEAAVHRAGLSISSLSSWGIGMPSYVNPQTGLLVHANCFGWKNTPIYDYLEPYLPLPVYIENDANCAALGEMLAGSAKGCKNAVLLTLGTGVGSGIILDGKLYSGADLMGAEFGHTKLVYGGRRCTCGQQGCIDAYCSATGLATLARERIDKDSLMWKLCDHDLQKLDAQRIVQAVESGDRCAARVWEDYIGLLAAAVSNLTALFRPEVVILGGGVAKAGETLLAPLRVKVLETTFAGKEIGVPDIRLAERGNDAGIIGAAMLEHYGFRRGGSNTNRNGGKQYA